MNDILYCKGQEKKKIGQDLTGRKIAKTSVGYKIFSFLNIMLMCVIIIFTLYPFLYILAMSFSNEAAIISGKVLLLPVNPNIRAYNVLLQQAGFWVGYKNTILQTTVGTIICLFMTIICAYPLSKKFLPGKNFLMKMMTFTMFFSGGLIPNYLLIGSLGLKDTIWAIALPGAISVYNMIVMRTFFQGIPESLEEAATIDGLNPWGVLLKIVLPLSKPIIATISLFTLVYYWNSWFPQLIYLNNNDMYPVTLFLRNIINGAAVAARDGTKTAEELMNQPAESLKSAAIILAALPILSIYPFIQKYFVQGMMIGSIKE